MNMFHQKTQGMKAVQRDLTNRVPLFKIKKTKKSQKTYRRKALPSISLGKDHEKGESESSEPNQGNISVMKLQKKKDGTRVYSKKHHCLYRPQECHKIVSHLIRKHSSELAVAGAISFPLKSKERKLHFDLIGNKGNHAHNIEVLKAGCGTLIPNQQTRKPVKANDYMHCINCQALLKRQSLWRHISQRWRQQNQAKVRSSHFVPLYSLSQMVSAERFGNWWMLCIGMNPETSSDRRKVSWD